MQSQKYCYPLTIHRHAHVHLHIVLSALTEMSPLEWESNRLGYSCSALSAFRSGLETTLSRVSGRTRRPLGSRRDIAVIGARRWFSLIACTGLDRFCKVKQLSSRPKTRFWHKQDRTLELSFVCRSPVDNFFCVDTECFRSLETSCIS
jgi:hypothetical protein